MDKSTTAQVSPPDPERRDLEVPDLEPDGTKVTVQTVALLILTTLAVFWALWVAADVVVPLLLAMMLKLVLGPAMRFMCDRMRLPESVSALLLVVVLFGVLTGIGLSIALPASGWIDKAPQGLQTLQDQLSKLRGPLASVQYYMHEVERLVEPTPPEPASTKGNVAVVRTQSPIALGSVGVSILLGTQRFFGRLVVLVVTLFFMLASGDSMLRKLVEAVPRLEKKKHVVFIVHEIDRNVSIYLATITAMNLAVGILTGCAMYLSGIADPLLWGTVAFLLNFVPIIGPLIGIGIYFLVALLSYGAALPALLPALIYLSIHITEGQFVTPLLLARRFTLSPLIVITSLFFWFWLWGIPGALLSVPLLATAKIVCDRIPSLAAMGHMLGAPNQRANSDHE